MTAKAPKDIWGSVLRWVPLIMIIVGLIVQAVTVTVNVTQLRTDLLRVESELKQADDKLDDTLTTHLWNNANESTLRNDQFLQMQVSLVRLETILNYLKNWADGKTLMPSAP